HALGFISGLDQADWLAEKLNLNQDNEDDYYSDLVGTLNNATPVDMMRFSRASYEESGDGENWIDMSIGGNPYLSFTGSGGTAVAYFATGTSNDLGGDGYQASHWKQQDNTLGIMDPVLGIGQKREITELDIQLFDAIGWDVNYNQSTDTQALYDQASAAIENASIEDRTEDVKKIINSKAYNARRSRRNTYRMISAGLFATTGYFSTFSPSVTDSSNSNSEANSKVVACIDNWVVITNHNWRSPQFGSFGVAEIADNYDRHIASSTVVPENLHKEEVAITTLAMNDSDDSNVESTLLDEIVGNLSTGLETSLETGWEIAIA
ncbi:MAG: NF038122 family metalloprotease, partial [Waterburya sp.]